MKNINEYQENPTPEELEKILEFKKVVDSANEIGYTIVKMLIADKAVTLTADEQKFMDSHSYCKSR